MQAFNPWCKLLEGNTWSNTILMWNHAIYFYKIFSYDELNPIKAYLLGMIFIRDFSSWNYMKKSKLIRLFLTWSLDCNRVNKYRRDRVGIRVLVPNTSHDRPQLATDHDPKRTWPSITQIGSDFECPGSTDQENKAELEIVNQSWIFICTNFWIIPFEFGCDF